MGKTAVLEMTLELTDVSQQKSVMVSGIPDDAIVNEMVQGVLGELNLPRHDVEGRPLSYQVFDELAGRHLRGDERVAEAVASGRRLVLQPNIDAGCLAKGL